MTSHRWKWIVAVWALFSCAAVAAQSDQAAWALWRETPRALDIVVAEDPALLRAATLLAGHLEGWDVAVMAEGDAPAGGRKGRARLVVGWPGSSPAFDAAARGVSGLFSHDGLAALGRQWTAPADLAACRVADPDAPRQAAFLLVGRDRTALAAALPGWRPAWRVGWQVVAGGDTAASGRWRADGSLDPARTGRDDSLVTAWLDGARRIQRGPVRFLVSTDSPDQAQELIRRAGVAAQPVLAWLGSLDMDLPPVEVVLFTGVAEKLQVTGDGSLAHISPDLSRVYMALGPGFGGDHESPLARALLERALGPPSSEWVAAGAAAILTPLWGGVEVSEWTARFARAGWLPAPRDLAAAGAVDRLGDARYSAGAACLLGGLFPDGLTAEAAALWRGDVVSPGLAAANEAWEAGSQMALAGLRTRIVAEESAVRRLDRDVSGLALTDSADARVGYGSSACGDAIEGVAALGARAVSLTPVEAATPDDQTSDDFFRGRRSAACDVDGRLMATGQQARLAGLAVVVRPRIPGTEYGLGMGDPMPRTEEEWLAFFDRYAAYLGRMAMSARRMGASLLVVGSGMRGTTAFRPDPRLEAWLVDAWRDLFLRTRSLFPGPLAYAAHVGTEAGRVAFWDAVDVVAADFLPTISTDSAPGPRDLRRGVRAEWRRLLGRLGDEQRPVLVTATGFTSTRMTHATPYRANGATDTRAQAVALEALLRGLAEEERVAGMLLLDWPTDPARGGPRDRGFTPRGKPAEEVLRAHWAAPRDGGR